MRKRMLPEGWYPLSAESVIREIDRWTSQTASVESGAVSGIAPHAGWYFSGNLAWMTWASAGNADIIVIAGGHAPPDYPVLVYNDDSCEVPGGSLEVHRALLSELRNKFSAKDDLTADNTVEIQLPFAACRFPSAPVVALRVPADSRAREIGYFLSEYAKVNKQTLFVLGSTDLTHYGPNYGFSPAGRGAGAVAWATENDRKFIDACLAMDTGSIVRTGVGLMASCSSGAAACAAAFAEGEGAKRPVLHAHTSSLAKHQDESFVGYCSISYYH